MIRTDWARGAAVALACLSAAACTDGFLHEPAAAGNARVAIIALQGVDGAEGAFDKADRLQIRVTERDGGRVLYDDAIPVSAGGGPIRASLDVDLSGRPVDASIEVGVRRGGDDLFLGEDQFTLIPGEESQVSLELRPVPSGLDVPEIPQFTTFGETFPLEGRVLFATGDEIPSARPSWSSQTPDVLAVRELPGGGYVAEALADGQGALTATFESVTESVPAPVRAVVVSAEMIPASVTLRRGESVELAPIYYDAGGSMVPGRVSDWQSQDESISEVDDTGRVLAVSVGQVDVSATHEGVSAIAQITVSDPPTVGTVGTRSVTPTGGTVGGTVNPQGLPTTVWFEYGLDPQLADAVETPRQNRSGLNPSDVVASLTGLTPGTTYYFRIIAENALGRTVSDIFSFTTPGALAAPTGLTAQRVPPAGIRIGWTDNSVGETRFEIERTAGGGPGSIVGSVAADITAWTDPAPPVNTTAYRVRACDDDACSAWSTPVAPPDPGPGNPAPGAPIVASLPTTFPSLGSARLGAAVSAAGASTTVRFEYGSDPQLVGAAQTTSRLLNPDATNVGV
ncbi:MAG: Ig-like domain-containing protein, partial [Gemmatimonadetes bacterium]|nr:Ig-like domain-containing protein [Gemmatimonadota bacterium]